MHWLDAMPLVIASKCMSVSVVIVRQWFSILVACAMVWLSGSEDVSDGMVAQ